MNRLIYILFLILICSCNGEDDNPLPEPGYNYFPIELGQYRDYEISITKYFLRPDSSLNMVVPDSSTRLFYSREIGASRFLDVEADSALRIEIFNKQNFDSDWPSQPDSIAVVKIKNDELIYEINNKTYVKLIFPVKNTLTWNGNKFNNMGDELYQITELGGSYLLNSEEISPSLTVTQSDVENLIEVDKRTEEYVLNVGLAKKNTRILQYRQSNGQVFTGDIEKGNIIRQRLIDYGEI